MEKIKIVKKEDMGKQDVYDIEVKDHHHYILEDGIISHNSGLKYFASCIIFLAKSKIKDKLRNTTGVILKARTTKNRFAKEDKVIKLMLDFVKGLNPFFGLQGERKSDKKQELENYCDPLLTKTTISGETWKVNDKEYSTDEIFSSKVDEVWTDEVLSMARKNMLKDIAYGSNSDLPIEDIVPIEEEVE